MYVFITILSVLSFIFYISEVRKTKFTTHKIVMIGLFSAISFVLSMIMFIRYPQGGGITLFSMAPTMILALLYGNGVGLTGGLIFSMLKLLKGVYMIHPLQFLLDYTLPTMALGLAGVFGRDSKFKVVAGCLLAGMTAVSFYILSGVVFFGEYAPEGMNGFVYSFLYNFSSAGVEAILCAILIAAMPLNRIAKIAKIDDIKKAS